MEQCSAMTSAPAPEHLRARLDAGDAVAWSAPVTIPTYEPGTPDEFPMFLDRRVYQGSSGRVYPIPFNDRISSEPTDRTWQAIHLENRWIRLHGPARARRPYPRRLRQDGRLRLLLPQQRHQAGAGRARRTLDLRRRRVQLAAAPPARDLPSGRRRDRERRRRRRHGLVLRPRPVRPDEGHARRPAAAGLVPSSSSVRGCTTAPSDVQTFLWWANVAAAGARRLPVVLPDRRRTTWPTTPSAPSPRSPRPTGPTTASTTRPARRDTGRRPDRLVPQHPGADVVHGARHRGRLLRRLRPPRRRPGSCTGPTTTSLPARSSGPGVTRRSASAWDRNLTDEDGPYVELMAGVFTDNQPDFAWLAPGETKKFSQLLVPDPRDRARAPGDGGRRRAARRRGRRGGRRRLPGLRA